MALAVAVPFAPVAGRSHMAALAAISRAFYSSDSTRLR
jgi:hypothetical protein